MLLLSINGLKLYTYYDILQLSEFIVNSKNIYVRDDVLRFIKQYRLKIVFI